MAEMKRILVVGGTGYLGQHLLAALFSSAAYHTAFTHHRPTPPPDLLAAVSPALALRVDLQTGDGFDAISHAFGQPDVVINCAAISAPRACETDPEAAMGTNVPSSLVNWLARLDRGGGGEPLLIHLSTDQVYEGVKSFYKEEDETVPVNTYGKSKVAAEQFISSKCSNYAILRSSIIYGPQTISPVSKSLPIQWVDNVLSQGHEVEFFHDEFRCPVYVQDVVNVILALIEKWVSELCNCVTVRRVPNTHFPSMLFLVQHRQDLNSASIQPSEKLRNGHLNKQIGYGEHFHMLSSGK